MTLEIEVRCRGDDQRQPGYKRHTLHDYMTCKPTIELPFRVSQAIYSVRTDDAHPASRAQTWRKNVGVLLAGFSIGVYPDCASLVQACKGSLQGVEVLRVCVGGGGGGGGVSTTDH